MVCSPNTLRYAMDKEHHHGEHENSMPGKSSDHRQAQEYRGTVTLPGETEPRDFALVLDRAEPAATIRFDTPAAGSTEWKGSPVRFARRLRYDEFLFSTVGLPKGAVELTWKCNAALEDGTLAGVVVARPNEERVTGEKGFSLVVSV